MKAFVAGLCAMAVIGVGAWYVLTQQLDYSSTSINTTQNDSVRLDPSMNSGS